MTINYFLKLQSKYNITITQMLKIMVEASVELLGDNFDHQKIKDYFYKQCQPLLLLHNSHVAQSVLEMELAVDRLLKIHEVELIDNGDVLKKCFYELSAYDKLVEIDGKIVPVILNHLFDHIAVYKEILTVRKTYDRANDSIERTIALSTSNTAEKMLAPLNPYIKNNLHNGEIKPKVYQKIVDAYTENAYATDFVLSAIRSVGINSLKNIETEQITAFDFASRFTNSSLQVHIKDIINSLRIAISMLYLKDHFYQRQLRLEQHITHEKLAEMIDLILSYIFNVNTLKKKTDPRRFKKKIQIRTHFDTIPLYEYARKGKEKIHPVLEDKEFLAELQEKIKGKISEISSVPKLSESI